MSSEATCFVYLQLPASLQVLTCGRYVLTGHDDGTFLGRFVYGRTYREHPDAVELDPNQLPIRSGTFETVLMRGIFGALRDASPDAWGRRIIERELGRAELTEADYLLHSPEDRAGALSFGLDEQPPAPRRRFNQTLQLSRLLEKIEEIEDEATQTDQKVADETPEHAQAEELLNIGTSLGGARPKAVVEDNEGLWIAKFPMRNDRWNNAPVEAAMLSLARLCGIRTPETRIERVAGKRILLVKRFDRERTEGGYLRHRMLSALTLLGLGDDIESRATWSYLRIADELRRTVGEPAAALHEMYRRMVFNALISNLDDHPRNHAVIAPGRAWQLSPAYDLTPSPVMAQDKRDLAMEVGAFNRYANRENILSLCARFLIERDQGSTLIDEIQHIVDTRWRDLVLQQGGTERDCEMIASAFNYAGFEYDPKEVLANL
jgi:serine/threonine-protein kinase HipA